MPLLHPLLPLPVDTAAFHQGRSFREAPRRPCRPPLAPPEFRSSIRPVRHRERTSATAVVCLAHPAQQDLQGNPANRDDLELPDLPDFPENHLSPHVTCQHLHPANPVHRDLQAHLDRQETQVTPDPLDPPAAPVRMPNRVNPDPRDHQALPDNQVVTDPRVSPAPRRPTPPYNQATQGHRATPDQSDLQAHPDLPDKTDFPALPDPKDPKARQAHPVKMDCQASQDLQVNPVLRGRRASAQSIAPWTAEFSSRTAPGGRQLAVKAEPPGSPHTLNAHQNLSPNIPSLLAITTGVSFVSYVHFDVAYYSPLLFIFTSLHSRSSSVPISVWPS